MWSGKGSRGIWSAGAGSRFALPPAGWRLLGKVSRQAVRETRGGRGKLPLPCTGPTWAGKWERQQAAVVEDRQGLKAGASSRTPKKEQAVSRVLQLI
jgi:hypothetical protein